MKHTLKKTALSLITVMALMGTSQMTKAVDHCGGFENPYSSCPIVCERYDGIWNGNSYSNRAAAAVCQRESNMMGCHKVQTRLVCPIACTCTK